MNYKIRRKERKDCADIAHVVTVAWNETYRGIVSDWFLEELKNTEEERAWKSYDSFDEGDNNQFVLEVDNILCSGQKLHNDIDDIIGAYSWDSVARGHAELFTTAK